MLLPFAGLNEPDLLAELGRQFATTADRAEFVPLGEDSWAYRVGELWVSLRRDLRGHVPQAYELATRLRESGLDFVLAPLRGTDGQVVRTVGDLPVVVFPYLDCTSLTAASASDAMSIGVMLDRLHSADFDADVPVETFELSFQDDLSKAMSLQENSVGPYEKPLLRQLDTHRRQLSADRAEIANLARMCRENLGGPVLTHGEPSAANIVRCDETLLLADWGAAMWGPPERDWFHVTRTMGIERPGRTEFVRFYTLRWKLSEIAEYAMRFADPHTGDAEDDAMWSRLLRYLPAL